MTGVDRIAEAFEAARANGRRAALMPYMMAGFPSLADSRRVAAQYVEGGADLIELGIPFSDPLADGPVIHAAAVAALRGGARVEHAVEVGRAVASEVPVVAMCYANPILARGLERFVDLLAGAGFSGLIVPDLPLEEADATASACDAAGLALVPLVAPTTPEERLQAIGRRARGFLYTVSVTGTTGERSALDDGLAGVIARARSSTDVPVAVGFGIGSPEQAAAAAEAGADGVIIGSRLVRWAEEDPTGLHAAVASFAAALREPALQ
ncbi:MAG TPA: tryptophan synthase subunit alpha [Solirubrobacteraceae bacterium]|jgi:tryptophan synthase alpha chain|nr:tryptophan synthase subunit alpha [Solirubrobacteraceae bacterium]